VNALPLGLPVASGGLGRFGWSDGGRRLVPPTTVSDFGGTT